MSSTHAPLVVIAGVGPGLGWALSEAFLRYGAQVVALTKAAEIASLPRREKEEIHVLGVELTDGTALDAVFSKIEETYGVPDVFIYNAGHLVVKSFLETTDAEMDECWKVNYHGAFLCAKRVVGGMLKRGSGTLMFTGASASYRGVPRYAACVASKHALRGLAETLAGEYEPYGLDVCHVIVDGLIWSEKVKKALNARPEDCLSADAIARCYVDLVARSGVRTRELFISARARSEG